MCQIRMLWWVPVMDSGKIWHDISHSFDDCIDLNIERGGGGGGRGGAGGAGGGERGW